MKELDKVDEQHQVAERIFEQLRRSAFIPVIISNPMVADAILDRLAYSSYKFNLKGESEKENKAKNRCQFGHYVIKLSS